MTGIELRTHPLILAARRRGLVPLARALQTASQGRVGLTLGKTRIGDLSDASVQAMGIDLERATNLLSQIVEHPLRPGDMPLELLLEWHREGSPAEETLARLYRTHVPFVAADVVSAIEARQLKVLLLGGAGSGVVSATGDMIGAFCSAGYYGRAFPLFDPSKKGAPVKGYGVVSREPILSHAPFEAPDIILLFDFKMFSLLRWHLDQYLGRRPDSIVIIVNTAMAPADFRAAADFHEPYALFTLDADDILRGKRIPPNYAMIGGMLGILGAEAVDPVAFAAVVRASLAAKFGAGEKVEANLHALERARILVKGEGSSWRTESAALGRIEKPKLPEGQVVLCEDGNRAAARAVALVLNQFPSVVAAYPITPQTQIVEHLAQMIADGDLSAEGVTPESEHGAGGAVMGAARDRVLAFTATCSQGAALMSEILHSIAGLRMGNVGVSNVTRSLNSPLDVEGDHGDFNKVFLDAGFLAFMTPDVQQAFDFHLMAYMVSLYAEYRDLGAGRREMIPDRAVMLPWVVASEGFEVSHAPERYLALTPEQAAKLYADPFFDYVKAFVFTPNDSVMGALALSNSREEADYQRHQAMELAYEVLKNIFDLFAKYTGRKYDFLQGYNVDAAEIAFVVAGAAYGAFEEVAREFEKNGLHVATLHPNVLRPFPKKEWAAVLKGKKVFVFDRDDPYGAIGGRLYTELAGVVNEFGLAQTGTQLFSRIYGLGGRTPTLTLVRDEIYKALRFQRGEMDLLPQKSYVGVSI
ncbi:MAG: 2-oxoacid:acceptor oxidoreductase family protein [Acidobacteria bacterium]|nr:2-oxoacid:acceptor oxidoreductase family protein [Acidobacteriota bacterium]MBI3656092.1 2-oxoacid:acceptor oxidoreductase family protein [Acidobacteriota bacterium]